MTIRYLSAEGIQRSGTIIWVHAPYRITAYSGIGVRYVVTPDLPTGFVDNVWPGDVIAVTQNEQTS